MKSKVFILALLVAVFGNQKQAHAQAGMCSSPIYCAILIPVFAVAPVVDFARDQIRYAKYSDRMKNPQRCVEAYTSPGKFYHFAENSHKWTFSTEFKEPLLSEAQAQTLCSSGKGAQDYLLCIFSELDKGRRARYKKIDALTKEYNVSSFEALPEDVRNQFTAEQEPFKEEIAKTCSSK